MFQTLTQTVRDVLQGKPGAGSRSSRWPSVRAAHLRRQPFCAACGGTAKLEVHHLIPFHVNPAKELDPSNLLTLCESGAGNCHLTFGHVGDYKCWNLYATTDAATHLLRRVEGRQALARQRLEADT